MRHRRLSVGLSIALMLGLVPSVAAAGTVRVDDDGKASATSCTDTTTAPKSVQAGIKAAGKNGTVIVCPGTYRGTIVIDGTRDGVTIVGADGFTSKLLPPAGGLGSSQPLVRIKSAADNVTLKRLAFRSPVIDCAVSEVVRIQGRGIKVLGNSFIGRDACVATVIRAIPPDSGTSLVAATVKGNTIREFLGAGVRGEDERTTLLVRDNAIWLDQADVPFDAQPIGVDMVEHVNGEVTGNTIGRGTEANSYHAAIRALVGESLLIDDNLLGDATSGIRLSFVQLMTVTNNTISVTQQGIFTDAFTNSTVQGNTLSMNGWGIRSADNTFNPDGNNLFKGNQITQSTDVGCLDEVHAEDGIDPNVWTENTADSDDPDGICPPPPAS